MTVSYIQSNPLNVEFKTTYGTPAAGMWAFFYSSLDQTQKKNAYKISSNAYVEAPNPVQLDASGGFPYLILFKYDSSVPSDKYVIKIRDSDSEMSPVLKTYIDIPRSGLYTDVSSGSGGILSGYPDISTGNVGDVLEIETDPQDPTNKIAVFKPVSINFAEQSIVNSVLTGCYVTILQSGIDISISAGKCLFVTKTNDKITSSVIIDVAQIPSLSIPNIANNDYTFVYIKNDGTFYTSNVVNEDLYGSYILLCSLSHVNRTNISDIVYRAPVGVGLPSQIRAIYDLLGFTSSCSVSKSVTTDCIDVSAGIFNGFDVGLQNTVSPHSVGIQAKTAASFFILSKNNTETGPYTVLNAGNLIKDDGTQVTSFKYAYFPIYQASNGRLVIQRTDKEYDSLPDFSEWYENFQINDALVKRYAILGCIAYKGGSALSDSNNTVFNVKNLGGKAFNISSIQSIPEIPSDASKAGYLIGVKDDNSAYEFRIKWDKSSSVQDGLATYNLSTNTMTFKPYSTSNPTLPTIPYDRPISYIIQKGGVILQRKSTDYVPQSISDYVDFTMYGGNYIKDISRGYTQTLTSNTTSDQDFRYIKFSDLFNLVSYDQYDATKYSAVFNGLPTTINNVPMYATGSTTEQIVNLNKGDYFAYNSQDQTTDLFRIVSFSSGTTLARFYVKNVSGNFINKSKFDIYMYDCGIFFEIMIKKYVDIKQLQEGNLIVWRDTSQAFSRLDGSRRYNFFESKSNLPTFVEKDQSSGFSSINTSSNPILISLINSAEFVFDRTSLINDTINFYYGRFYYLTIYKTFLSTIVSNITFSFLLKISFDNNPFNVYPDRVNDEDVLTICCRFSSSVNNFSTIVTSNASELEFGNGFGFFVSFRRDGYNIYSFNSSGELTETNPIFVASTATSIETLLANGIKFTSVLSGATSYYGVGKTMTDGSRFFMCSANPVNITLFNKPKISLNISISGFSQVPGAEHVRLDTVKLGQFNVAADTAILKRGLRNDDIVPGIVHFVVTWVLKNNKNPLEYMELNPHYANLSPFRLILIDGSSELKCDVCAVFVGRMVFKATVTQTQITNSIVVLRVYKNGTIQPVAADILDRYTISIGVMNRQGTN